MSTVTFNSETLRTQESVAQFLSGEQEAGAIVNSSATATPPTHVDEVSSLVSGYLLTVAYWFLRLVCFTDLSKKIWVQSRHALDNAAAIKTQKVFQENLLARSINAHRKDTEDFYLQPSAPPSFTDQITDSLNYFHNNGICRGMCYWFIHLYFKTQSSFSDPEQHLQAVARQFEQGAPRQAAFLQSIKNLPFLYDLLKLNLEEDVVKIKVEGKKTEEILQEMQPPHPGVYGINTSSHQVMLFKFVDNRQYLFDPMIGCVKISSPELFKNAMERYLETHDKKKEIILDSYSPLQIN